jgi:hypothetical protein
LGLDARYIDMHVCLEENVDVRVYCIHVTDVLQHLVDMSTYIYVTWKSLWVGTHVVFEYRV